MSDKPAKIDADGKLRFGRWKGVRLQAAPLGYLAWCVIASQDFDDATLMALAREVHGRLKAVLTAAGMGHLVAGWPAGAAAIGPDNPVTPVVGGAGSSPGVDGSRAGSQAGGVRPLPADCGGGAVGEGREGLPTPSPVGTGGGTA